VAASNGYHGVVKLLIEREANIDEKNEDGETALDLALDEDHKDIVKLLLQNGADIKNAIDVILTQEWGASFFVNLFKDSYLTYEDSHDYVFSILQEIDSSPQNQEFKAVFSATLVNSLDNNPFDVYCLYNIDFPENQKWVQDSLKEIYKEISLFQRFIYSIRHFLEEYVIYPIGRENELISEQPASASGKDDGTADEDNTMKNNSLLESFSLGDSFPTEDYFTL
jgi:hypothetical protein